MQVADLDPRGEAAQPPGRHTPAMTAPPTSAKVHWEQVYSSKDPTEVSWYQEHAASSLTQIQRSGLPRQGAIIDVGGGASTLVDDLLERGFVDLSVLDVAGTALAAARARQGPRATQVRWIEGDVLTAELPPVDLWHDRAVLHFLTDPQDRSHYVHQLESSLRPAGHVILATFAPDGPQRCSGLPVMRYSADDLADLLGPRFELVETEREEHRTPLGTVQAFTYTRFVRT